MSLPETQERLCNWEIEPAVKKNFDCSKSTFYGFTNSAKSPSIFCQKLRSCFATTHTCALETVSTKHFRVMHAGNMLADFIIIIIIFFFEIFKTNLNFKFREITRSILV